MNQTAQRTARTKTTMRDHITPAMHRHFMSMFERDIASARNRNTTSEHPNPQSLIPSNLLDSLPQQPPPPPRHDYSAPPSVTKETCSMLSNPDPQTPPCLGSQRPPSLLLSRLLTSSRQQQWLYCTPEQADIWKPRKNELETLNKKLKKHVRFAFPHDADEEDAHSEQKPCQPKQHPPSSPPKGSLPTRPTPHHDTETNHSPPALQYLDHKLLTIKIQRLAEETTHRAGLQRHASFARRAHAHQASESVEFKLAKSVMRERRWDEEEEGVEPVLGDGGEKGEVLCECEGGQGEEGR